jgi:isoquinoline 1-oxidoreductase alpha subunit
MIEFKINSRSVSFDGDSGTPLLWVIRDHLQLTGTKYGCGVGECGSCTVHVNGRARKACMIPVRSVAGRSVKTIEGLAPDDNNLHPVQRAWLAAVDFLEKYPQPTDEDIDNNIDNLCRCGTYVRIRKAIHAANLSSWVSAWPAVSSLVYRWQKPARATGNG